MKKLTLFVLIIIVALMASCSSPKADPTAASTPEPALSEETEVPAADTPVPEVVESPADTEVAETPEAVVTAEPVVHTNVPVNAVFSKQTYEECNTFHNFNMGTVMVGAPCDNWGTNLIERPVSADLKTFYGYLDILSSSFGTDYEWFFGNIEVYEAGMPDDGADVTYFLELDVDQDGRGDYLVAVTNLGLDAAEWTVDGVRVWKDTDGDVGGPTAIRPDTTTGNGYETLLFDSGQGDDPDLAWARRRPDTPNHVQFAFKTGMLEGKNSLMWWAGAMRGTFDAGQFDFVDSQAADALFEYDNTCGWVFGSETGYNVKKCFVPLAPTAKPGEDPVKVSGKCPNPTPPPPNDDPCWDYMVDEYDYHCEWVCNN